MPKKCRSRKTGSRRRTRSLLRRKSRSYRSQPLPPAPFPWSDTVPSSPPTLPPLLPGLPTNDDCVYLQWNPGGRITPFFLTDTNITLQQLINRYEPRGREGRFHYRGSYIPSDTKIRNVSGNSSDTPLIFTPLRADHAGWIIWYAQWIQYYAHDAEPSENDFTVDVQVDTDSPKVLDMPPEVVRNLILAKKKKYSFKLHLSNKREFWFTKNGFEEVISENTRKRLREIR